MCKNASNTVVNHLYLKWRCAVHRIDPLNTQSKTGVAQIMFNKNCRNIQRSDGHNFTYGAAMSRCTKAHGPLAENR